MPVSQVVAVIVAASGTYKVVVDKWAAASASSYNPDWTGSRASVQMYDGPNFAFGGFKAPPSDCGTKRYWYVGELAKGSDTPYAFTPHNACTNVKP